MADEPQNEHENIGGYKEEELREAFAGPAPIANKVIVSMGPAVRISFLEIDPTGKTYYRTAAALHPFDAIELKNLLIKMLADVEREVASAESLLKGK
jgi:hypothetical protein